MWYEVTAFRWLLLAIFFTLAIWALVGCATFEGVQMDQDEAKACKEQGCSVWTDEELKRLYMRGVQDGIKHARSNGV